MSTTWPMRLDLDAERHLPREWWAEGEDDCLPDGVGEEEAWALIRRSAAPSYHSITLAAEHAVVRMQDAATATRTAASAAGASREPAGGDRVDEGPSEAAHPGSVLLRPSEVAKRLALSESRIFAPASPSQMPSR